MNALNNLEVLLEGNRRFVEGSCLHPHQDRGSREACAKGQSHPVAVLACADSRVAPELLFDQGLGDLFVTRVAGNLVNEMILGSLEYAVQHLGTRLIMVLGHKRCGAVATAIKGGDLPGHLPCLVQAIQAAVQKSKGLPGDLVDNAVKINVVNAVVALESLSPILAEFVKKGELKLVGGVYDLDTGRVELVK